MNVKSILCIALFFLAFLVNISQVKSQYTLNVIVQTDKTSYLKRELVNVTGNVTFQGELVQNGLIGIQVENPLRTILIRTLQLNTTTMGQFTLKITSLFAFDDFGNFKQSSERGKYLWFNMTVKNKGISPQTVFVSVTIVDNKSIPLDTSMASFTIQPGKTGTFTPRMYIPNWATIGTASVYGNVYDSWPKNEGRPLCPEKLWNLNIIESIYYDGPPNATSPSQPVQSGTYEMNFRLPPDMVPGAYQVTASAWSPSAAGEGSSSTSFDANYVPSPPWASFVIKPPIAGPNYTITFDASSSSSEGHNDSITNYFWTFGDGKNTTGKVVTHSYKNIGNYMVTLNVTDSEGFWNTTTKEVFIMEIHDIAVLDIDCLNEVYDSWIVYVTVTIKNKGTMPETLNITLYSNSSEIEVKQINIDILQTLELTFTWDTNGLIVLENYYLEAKADIHENETDPTDNALTFGPISVKLLGDVIFDRIIDIFDVSAVTMAYDSEEGDPNWYLPADLLRDGIIDIYDISVVTIRYDTVY